MANEEHVEILKEGVEAWNDWRKESSVTPDLSKAYLTETNLVGADLGGANLSRAKLISSNLRKANLIDADLNGAQLAETDLHRVDLIDANLAGANLISADLSGADLINANLDGAQLIGADLSRADLSEANLSEVRMGRTLFFQTRLEGTEGLDAINHSEASNLDHFTIAQSDPLPLSFLRGCGLPDLIINNTEALRGDPFELYSCFISHSSDDQDFADRLYADLQDEGVRCWYAPQNLRGGEKTHRQIEEAIRHHDKLVLILSEASMESNWVKHEIREAREREREEDRQVLFPVSLVPYSKLGDWELFYADEGGDLAREIREYYIPDFSDWKDHDEYSEAFDKLFRGLKEKS